MPTLIDSVLTPIARLERRLRHEIKFRRHCARIGRQLSRGAQPVVVFSPQKTGSSAVQYALMPIKGVCRMGAHVLRPEHEWDGDLDRRVHADGTILLGSHVSEAIRRIVLGPRLPSKWIVTIREPVGCNLSCFAFHAERNWLRDHRLRLEALSADELTKLFLDRYPHDSIARWPALELQHVLGFDPYSTPFPHGKGYQRLQAGPFDLMIMRQDLDDPRKAAALNEHLDRSDIAVHRANESSGGPGGIYARLKRGIRKHPEYIDRMLSSRDARHWWSEAERTAIRDKWMGAGSDPPSPAPPEERRLS